MVKSEARNIKDLFNRELLHILDRLEEANDSVIASLDAPLQIEGQERTIEAELEVPLPTKRVYESKKRRSKYLKRGWRW